MLVEAALGATEYGNPADEPNKHGGTLLPIPEVTDTREQQKSNRDAMIDLIRGLALLEAMNVAVNADYGSREEAQDVVDRVMASFDAVLEEIGDNSKNDEVFQTLLEVKPFFINAMERKGASLPATNTVETPAEPYPTLIMAYDLYTDLGRENEIIARNPVDIMHPAFPAGGVELEVSSE
jgi:prophage DNA circulation protein